MPGGIRREAILGYQGFASFHSEVLKLKDWDVTDAYGWKRCGGCCKVMMLKIRSFINQLKL